MQAHLLSTLDLLFTIVYSLAVTIQLFVPCYYATNVIEKSNKLSRNIYFSNWIDADIIYKKSFQIFVTRSLKPFILYAGGLIPLNVDIFFKVRNDNLIEFQKKLIFYTKLLQIIKTAYSLLSVLKSTETT